MQLRVLLFIGLVLCTLSLGVALNPPAHDNPSVQAVIMAPLHRSVARRQSLHIDVDILMDGGLIDVFGILYIDGKIVAYLDTFPVRSIVGNVSDGVHNITFNAVGAHNQVLYSVSHEVQVAVQWAPSLWHDPEVFIWSPVDGDLFTLHHDDRMHDVPVRVSVHAPLPQQLIEVFLNGVLVRSFSPQNLSFIIPAVGIGSHLISVICGDAQATSVFSVQLHQLPVFIPQPSNAPSAGFVSLPPQTVSALPGHSGPSLRSISICILAFPGSDKHLALRHTLKSLHSSGLIPSAELLVFVQGLDDSLIEVAHEYGAGILGFGRPIGKGNAWRHLTLAASRPLVLLLEEDFSVVTSPALALEVCCIMRVELCHVIYLPYFCFESCIYSRSIFNPLLTIYPQRLMAASTLLLGKSVNGNTCYNFVVFFIVAAAVFFKSRTLQVSACAVAVSQASLFGAKGMLSYLFWLCYQPFKRSIFQELSW